LFTANGEVLRRWTPAGLAKVLRFGAKSAVSAGSGSAIATLKTKTFILQENEKRGHFGLMAGAAGPSDFLMCMAALFSFRHGRRLSLFAMA
jgi:hypothetical protein